MADNPMTVRELFFGGRGGDKAVGHELEKGKGLEELQRGLQSEIGNVRWKLVAKEIVQQILAVLDFGIAERVLAPAWQRWQLLQEYRDPEAHPPEESALVPLYEHSVLSEHVPHIDLLVKEVEIGRLEMQVQLAIDLEGVVLRIQDGRIWGIQSGSAAGRGSLACSYAAQTIYELERQTRKFEVATGIGFEKGIEIPALDLEA